MKMNSAISALLALATAVPLGAEAVEARPSSPPALSPSALTLEALAGQLDRLQAAAGDGLVWTVNIDLRCDYAPYKLTAKEQAGSAKQPLVHYGLTSTAGAGALSDAPANGYAGAYVRRLDLGATGKLSSWALLGAQIDLVGLKLEDTGVTLKGLPLLPGLVLPGYAWDARIGVYRQPFGIENQVSASSIVFPERAILNGGYCPAAFSASTPTKLVYERIVGAQLDTGHSYGAVAYKVQVAVADDQKDQDAGSSSTLGAFGGALSSTTTYTAGTATAPSLGLTTDQDPSEFARVGIDLDFFPQWAALNLGASAIHNPCDTALLSTSGTSQSWQDTYGFDGSLDIPAAQTKLQAEWVAQNSFSNASGAGLLTNRAEGWYVQSSTRPLAFFDGRLSGLELNLRLESVTPNVNMASAPGQGPAAQFTATSVQANTVALKYSYKGKTYTSVNYSNYALNGNYKAVAGSSLLSVQQQFNY